MTSPNPAPKQTLPFNRLKIIGFALLFVLLSVMVPFSIQQELNNQTDRLWNALFTPWMIVLTVALLTIYYLSDALRLWFTLHALGQHQPLRAMLPLVFINILFSNITPMATGGGVVQVWFLHRRGINIGAATAATTLRTLLASLMIFLPAPFLIMGIDSLVNSSTISAWAPWMALFATLYVAFFVALLLRLRWFIQLGTTLLLTLRKLHLINASRERRWRFRLRREMIRFDCSFRTFFKASRTEKLLALASTATFLMA
ncbi:MAG: flippase-like domain-containing protein, partial [Pusillimonas sp.]|nr:flippase-like domain-containing protein [Pusillimonas sp.]